MRAASGSPVYTVSFSARVPDVLYGTYGNNEDFLFDKFLFWTEFHVASSIVLFPKGLRGDTIHDTAA